MFAADTDTGGLVSLLGTVDTRILDAILDGSSQQRESSSASQTRKQAQMKGKQRKRGRD